VSTLAYRRSRFATRLPLGRLYTAAHYWLEAREPDAWRVGFTRFATRMLGDLVEYQFEAEAGAGIALGQKIGWVEGFKAVSELYAVVEGEFVAGNPELANDVTLVDTDGYGRGWLYEARGRAEPTAVDAQGYAAILDATIDRMLEKQGRQG
jgi:glycine cleavage system H protein